jgi:hypothetical protein
MVITLPCACGKSLKVNADLAGRRVKCPACGGVVAVPPPGDDAGLDLEADEPDYTAPKMPRERKKKKKKKKKLDPVAERERQREAYERSQMRAYWRRRLLRGLAFIVLGLIVAAGAIYLLARHSEDVNPVYSAVFLAMGVIAVAKGGIGIVAGQFFGEDE